MDKIEIVIHKQGYDGSLKQELSEIIKTVQEIEKEHNVSCTLFIVKD